MRELLLFIAVVSLTSACTTIAIHEQANTDVVNQCKTDAEKISDTDAKERMLEVCTKMGSPTSKKGMPFYTKKSVYSQETTWQHVNYVVSVSYQLYESSNLKKPINTVSLGKVLVPQEIYYNDEMNAVVSEVAKIGEMESIECESENECPEIHNKLKGLVTAFNALRTKARLAVSGSSTIPRSSKLVGNKVTREMVVDTSRTFYINGRRPIVGSGKVNFELASDQTLTKVESEAESKTLETLTSLLPLTEFFTEQWGLAPDPPDPEEEVSPTLMVKVIFSAKPEATTYTLKKVGLSEAERASIPPLPKKKAKTGEYELTVSRGSSGANKGKTKKGYAIEGKVLLPE